MSTIWATSKLNGFHLKVKSIIFDLYICKSFRSPASSIWVILVVHFSHFHALVLLLTHSFQLFQFSNFTQFNSNYPLITIIFQFKPKQRGQRSPSTFSLLFHQFLHCYHDPLLILHSSNLKPPRLFRRISSSSSSSSSSSPLSLPLSSHLHHFQYPYSLPRAPTRHRTLSHRCDRLYLPRHRCFRRCLCWRLCSRLHLRCSHSKGAHPTGSFFYFS